MSTASPTSQSAPAVPIPAAGSSVPAAQAQIGPDVQATLGSMWAQVRQNVEAAQAELQGAVPGGASASASGPEWDLSSLIDPDLYRILTSFQKNWPFQSFVVGVQNVRLNRKILAALQALTTPPASGSSTGAAT
jgi:hypothetical protein